MKFYSYTNNNRDYTKAINLENVRSLHLSNGVGKSAIRFSVRVEYADGQNEHLPYLEEEEVTAVYRKILELLNTN